MKNYATKFKHIIPTLLCIILGSTIIVLTFRWLFSIQSNFLNIKEEVFEIWLPLIFPWIPITIWLRPKLRILKFKKENSDAPMLFQFITWITMAAIMIISNSYLKTATYHLAEINSIDELEILDEHRKRYIRINKFELDKQYGTSHTEFGSSGKYNQHFNFDTYFVYPIETNKTDLQFKYWYGVKMHKQISNKLSPKEKERKYKEFYKKSHNNFKNYKFFEPDYFEILPHSNDREGFLSAILRHEDFKSINHVIIEPKKGLYSNMNGQKFEWIFGSFGIGFAVFLLVLIFPQFDSKEHERQLKGIKPKSDDIVDMLKFLIPKEGHFVTSIILDLNILMFIIMIFSGIDIISPNGGELLEWGANRRNETLNGDWWRLVSSMFLHGGFMHLLLNIYGLVVAAIFIEPIFGRTRYFTLYFISGICGSLASVYWYENTISVGASGAIFGLYGAILGLLFTNAFEEREKKTTLLLVGPFVGISLLFGFTGGIDNAAHIGGLVSGALIGIILHLTNNNKN